MNTLGRFYVVAITTTRYKVLSRHQTASGARESALSRPYRKFGCVVRDGNTGKRYCLAELDSLVNLGAKAA